MRKVKEKNVHVAKYISDITGENYSTTDIRNSMIPNTNKNETQQEIIDFWIRIIM